MICKMLIHQYAEIQKDMNYAISS